MGITKRAVTVIGLRVKFRDITSVKVHIRNLCICNPLTPSTVYRYCPTCGKELGRRAEDINLEDICKELDDGTLSIKGYKVIGDWRTEEYGYISFFASKTYWAHTAEVVDAARARYTDAVFNVPIVRGFEYAMKELGLWDPDEFGVWTILQVET